MKGPLSENKKTFIITPYPPDYDTHHPHLKTLCLLSCYIRNDYNNLKRKKIMKKIMWGILPLFLLTVSCSKNNTEIISDPSTPKL